jgi:signal transduction histidine kinase
MWLAVWLFIALIGVAHYATAATHHWMHDLLRRLYYLPIVLAAFACGLRGGLAASLVTSLTYTPHAFFLHGLHDPAPGIEKVLEIVLYNAVGAVAGYLADLERRRRTDLQRALHEQQRLQRELVRAGRLSALGEVVAGIAHEVKNPLHALAGTAEVIDPLISADRDERRLWDLHVAEIARLQRVAERFLSFARPAPPARAPLDLRDVVARVADLVGADARRKGVVVEYDLPPQPATVLGDRDQLAQIGLNVAVNAVQAIGRGGRGGGRVRLSLHPERRDGRALWAVRVENDGPPLADEEREHLFDPFHGDQEGGAGLGLSISSRIADQHDGWLEAANAGLGVTFTLWLPAA